MNLFKIVLPGSKIRHSRLEEEVVDSQYPSPKVDTAANPPHVGIIFLNWVSPLVFALDEQKILYSFKHNYNYVPSTLMTFKFDNGVNKGEGAGPLGIGGIGVLAVSADNTNFYLKYISTDNTASPVNPFTAQVRFYVFAERGYE